MLEINGLANIAYSLLKLLSVQRRVRKIANGCIFNLESVSDMFKLSNVQSRDVGEK